jgi:hypothetical protein
VAPSTTVIGNRTAQPHGKATGVGEAAEIAGRPGEAWEKGNHPAGGGGHRGTSTPVGPGSDLSEPLARRRHFRFDFIHDGPRLEKRVTSSIATIARNGEGYIQAARRANRRREVHRPARRRFPRSTKPDIGLKFVLAPGRFRNY